MRDNRPIAVGLLEPLSEGHSRGQYQDQYCADACPRRRYVVRRGLQVSFVVWSPFKSHPFFTTWGKD